MTSYYSDPDRSPGQQRYQLPRNYRRVLSMVCLVLGIISILMLIANVVLTINLVNQVQSLGIGWYQVLSWIVTLGCSVCAIWAATALKD